MDVATFGKKFICEVKNLNSVYSKLTAEFLPVNIILAETVQNLRVEIISPLCISFQFILNILS